MDKDEGLLRAKTACMLYLYAPLADPGWWEGRCAGPMPCRLGISSFWVRHPAGYVGAAVLELA